MSREQKGKFLKIPLGKTLPPEEEHSCAFVFFVCLLARFVNSLRIDLKSPLYRKYFYLNQWNLELTIKF